MRADYLDEIVDHYRVALGARLKGLVLYGSRARGDARPDSDVDMLLLAEGLPADPWERLKALHPPKKRDLCTDPDVSVRALTPGEYERSLIALDLDIALDGKILFDRDEYVADRLALIRRRIDEAGTYRDSRLFWRWKRIPTVANWAIEWDGVRV